MKERACCGECDYLAQKRGYEENPLCVVWWVRKKRKDAVCKEFKPRIEDGGLDGKATAVQ